MSFGTSLDFNLGGFVAAAQLSDRDRLLIRKLRGDGVLQDFKDHLLDQRDGAILIGCADGDQFPDLFERQKAAQAHCRDHPRIHPLTCHGGALAYVSRSPVNGKKGAHNVYLGQIPDAKRLKGINLVALYVHAPCGAAHLAGLDVDKVIAYQMQAKLTIKIRNPGMEVACFFHVDYANGRKRTYFICRKDWRAWGELNSIETEI